jgi:hypothetical protein
MKRTFALGVLAVCLVAFSSPAASGRAADCRPVRAIFYDSTDWIRLAQTLAADASPCAQYYVSVPPLVADKTQARPNVAQQIRALGPSFHAVAEFNVTAWQSWVSANGGSWYAAGQEQRRRMAAAGFDVAAGDTWDVNEFSSAVRTGSGSARQNMRDLVRGLHDGDGSVAPVQGIVFVIGISQPTTPLDLYKANLESWLQDSSFWNDMSASVSDFMQEDYGDVRSWAVAGEDVPTRTTYLNQFLQHPLQLAGAGGAATATAASYLAGAYGPLANAAWPWSSGYGWTLVGSDVMADYVSAETYAMRSFGGPRLGFVWAPNPANPLGLADFTSQAAAVLARLAGAVHASDDPANPGGACTPTGCASVVDGAAPATGWAAFSSWTPTAAVLTSAPVTAAAATASPALTLQLQTGGIVTTLPVPSAVALSSSSPAGTFATDPNGPWTASLTLTIPAGASTASFYYEDATPGTPTITASLNGQVSTQCATITAPAPAPAPAPAAAGGGGSTGTPAAPTASPAAPPAPPAPPVTPPPPPPPAASVRSLAFSRSRGRLHLTLRVADASGQPLPGRLSLAVLRDSAVFAATTGATRTDGTLGLTARPRLTRGCYTARIKWLNVAGYR